MWEREEGLVIEKAWKNRNPCSDLGSLAEALQGVTKELKCWSRVQFDQVARHIEKL